MVGLDYSNDRQRWLRWHEQDLYGRSMAKDQPRHYMIQGRVVDVDGKPIADATIAASPATTFSKFLFGGGVSGWVNSDADGRFLLRFGIHAKAKNELGIVPSDFHVSKEGFALTSFSTVPRRYLSTLDLANDPILQIAENEMMRPGVPLNITFVMQPGVVLSATAENGDGTPVEAKSVNLQWNDRVSIEPNPFRYCKCCGEYFTCNQLMPWDQPENQIRSVMFKKQSDSSFLLPATWPGVPRKFSLIVEQDGDKVTYKSANVTFDQSGHYRVRLILDDSSKTLRLITTAIPKDEPAEARIGKVSPFYAVRWRDSEPDVQIDGQSDGEWLKLVALNDIPAAEIVAFSRRTYGERFQKRFEEDLVDVLHGMKHPPRDEVSLTVQSLQTMKISIRKNVPMTSDNR